MNFFRKNEVDCRDNLKTKFLANLVWLMRSAKHYSTSNITINYEPKNEIYTMNFAGKIHEFSAMNHIELTEKIIKIIEREYTQGNATPN